MWAYESVFYQIYPLGFCGAPFENDGVLEHRIKKVEDWIPHIKNLETNAIYFSPLFESDTHGYNTRDYKKIDVRLGSNEDFKEVCEKLHEADIKVVLDGVFNHVGRGFWAFQDVLKNREASPYVGWFYINFGGNSNYNDGLWYEGWEGNFDLVKLNLGNEEVVQHLLDSVKYWIEYFDIDGIRLDVAYLLSHDFLKRLRGHCDGLKADFFLLGEMIYNEGTVIAPDMLHSATNYECYKGLYSSFNSLNMYEIIHSLLREFGPEKWSLYKGMHLLSFVDNHDVSRIASILTNEKHIPLIYAMCFGMPGIPCVYYGSEWGALADKKDGDPGLRKSFDAPVENELSEWIGKLAKAKKGSDALNYGTFSSVVLTNQQCIFERRTEKERVLVAINAGDTPYSAHFDARSGQAVDLITGKLHDFGGGVNWHPIVRCSGRWNTYEEGNMNPVYQIDEIKEVSEHGVVIYER
ncbi:maltodextrin glucosidase [Clostridia bacterium]|nr:maltodextrin glucosidase [Clostridia bacterium]